MALYNANSSNFANSTLDSWLVVPETLQGDGRSVPEIIVKAVLLAIATLVATWNLARLRGQPTPLASYQTIVTFLIPTFPVGDFLISLFRTVKASRSAEKSSWNRYTICSALDVRASGGNREETVPLHLIPLAEVQAVVLPYDTKWFARLAVLLLFLLQMLYTILLWVRRAMFGTRALIDDCMVWMALCGLTVTLLSLSITTINTKWTCAERFPDIFQRRLREARPIDLLVSPGVPLEVIISCFMATMFQSVAVLSLRTAFAKEFFHKWQRSCLEIPNFNPSDLKSSITLELQSLLYNLQLYDCDYKTDVRPHAYKTPWFFQEIIQLNADASIIFQTIDAYLTIFWLVAFVLAVGLSWLGIQVKVKALRVDGMFTGWTAAYFVFKYFSTILTVWQLINADGSTPWSWKWKDPWAGVSWSFGT